MSLSHLNSKKSSKSYNEQTGFREVNFMEWIRKVNLEDKTLPDHELAKKLKEMCPPRDENISLGKTSAYSKLRTKVGRGLAFTRDERLFFQINALLPYVVKTGAQQVEYCHTLIDRLPDLLDKYRYLIGLSERNERLFYMVIRSNIEKILPIIYTPNITRACKYYSYNFFYPKGLFITYADKGHIVECLKQWPERTITAICVTDGERILGMGDLGANSMPVPVSKCILCTAFAGVKPQHSLPITIDVGTNNKRLLNDPFYLGLKQKRVQGAAFITFMDEFMIAVQDCFGQGCVVQFGDFGKKNSLQLLDRYQPYFCCFNHDVQCSAAVVVAAILNSMKLTKCYYRNQKLLLVGAGQAAIGVARLYEMLLLYMGLSGEEAKETIWLFDTKGLVVRCRPSGGLDEHKLKFGHDHRPIESLLEVIEDIRPTALIGLSNTGGIFSPEILTKMAELNTKPIIMALSNPTNQAECSALQAYTYTNGTCIFGTGASIKPFKYNGETYRPSICNDSLIFPGLILGINSVGLTHIPNELFLLLARKIALLVNDDEIAEGGVLPSVKRITEISPKIAQTVMEYSFRNNISALKIEPYDKFIYLRAQMYDTNYTQLVPDYFYKNRDKLLPKRKDEEEEKIYCN